MPRLWREVGMTGEFASWLRALKCKVGCYVIRDKATHRTLYEGETTDLYAAITRHFQHWRGTKGLMFDRDEVEVSVRRVRSRQLPSFELPRGYSLERTARGLFRIVPQEKKRRVV